MRWRALPLPHEPIGRGGGCYDGDVPIGGARLNFTGVHGERWFWFCTAARDDAGDTPSGWCDRKDEAKAAVEAAYARLPEAAREAWRAKCLSGRDDATAGR